MRVYFEKPRTTVGWKGLINDPNLNDSFDINLGLHTARALLRDIVGMGLGTGTEYPGSHHTAIRRRPGVLGGDRCAHHPESQIHRQLASGLSCPTGFKNSTPR